jgi:tRNAHis guanylyltransferase
VGARSAGGGAAGRGWAVKPETLEARMRAREVFHTLRLLPGAWVVLRVDGRGFSRFTQGRYEKPFDARLHALMVDTTRALVTDLQALYGYTESDEISILLPRDTTQFDRELEKLVSISAAVAAERHGSSAAWFSSPAQSTRAAPVHSGPPAAAPHRGWSAARPRPRASRARAAASPGR